MNETRRMHLEAIPPVPAILGAFVSVQAGAAVAKGFVPALGQYNGGQSVHRVNRSEGSP
jgi:threonine/homoserine efflux transporter RhtA